MHEYFIDAAGNYFVTITPIETPEGVMAVPPRPSVNHEWNGDGWVVSNAPPEVAEPPVLTPAQWSYLLDLTGFGAAIEGALAGMPKGTLEQRMEWAALKTRAYKSESYRLGVTLSLAASLRAKGVAAPTDAQIEQAWPLALSYSKVADSLANP